MILLGSFQVSWQCFGFRLVLVDEFTKIVPSASRPFIGYHQDLFASVKIFFFFKFLKIFIKSQKL